MSSIGMEALVAKIEQLSNIVQRYRAEHDRSWRTATSDPAFTARPLGLDGERNGPCPCALCRDARLALGEGVKRKGPSGDNFAIIAQTHANGQNEAPKINEKK